MALHQDVIVGIDGSAPSEEAAAWALKELRGSGRTLNLVHVITPAGPESAAESELRSAGDEVLTRLSVRLAHLDAAHPDGASDTTIDTEVVIGDPAEALSALASDASLLVLGHHGAGQGNSPRLGTVSFGLPGHALSSVLVHRVRTGSEFDDPAAHPTMRSGPGLPPTTGGSDAPVDAVPADDGNARADAGPGRTRGVVVVGLDTSEYAAVAALDAAEFAVGSGQRLRVLVGVDALADAAARARAEADLAWLRREFPTLDADAEFPTGDPVDALIRASEDADLIAIGKRGIGQFAAMTSQLGRTSSAVLSGAHSSVLLVTFRPDPRLESRTSVRR